MSLLKEKLRSKFPQEKAEIAKLLKENGDKIVSQVTLAQAYGGLRGVKGLVCDTSEVPPDKGLIIRGHELKTITDKLPEEIFFLLLTGQLPDATELKDLQHELKTREVVPNYVWSVLNSMPADSHPMTMFNTAVLVMQHESVFAKRYAEGIKKDEYWDATYEDAMNIIAKLPAIAAYVYRKRFNKGQRIESDKNADWAGNYVHMLGLPNPNDEFAKLMRLYLTLHSDHEGGNVSAYSAATINSALSDLYYSLSGGLNGLAGPLHGLANQECLGWILDTMKKFNGAPSKEQLEQYAWETLNSGKVVPGYGHAVLRITDPRYAAFLAFGKQYMSNDPVFQTVARVFEVVPTVLTQVQKIKDPWPNVDAGSGGLLYHYGLKEFSYYTVLFSVSRALGICSQAIVARAMGYAITRPKSLPTAGYKKIVSIPANA
ncbi:MAG: type I citrate synthase [Bacteroidetes bacterium CG23_combo_of_CG06-09_8_20_14_all_32_9]|nr:MAG: type I citrate synthase [Bacteroidetes bacterium CG23_combo_of_CG06-09_8_20_14_all_32_9]